MGGGTSKYTSNPGFGSTNNFGSKPSDYNNKIGRKATGTWKWMLVRGSWKQVLRYNYD